MGALGKAGAVVATETAAAESAAAETVAASDGGRRQARQAAAGAAGAAAAAQTADATEDGGHGQSMGRGLAGGWRRDDAQAAADGTVAQRGAKTSWSASLASGGRASRSGGCGRRRALDARLGNPPQQPGTSHLHMTPDTITERHDLSMQVTREAGAHRYQNRRTVLFPSWSHHSLFAVVPSLLVWAACHLCCGSCAC